MEHGPITTRRRFFGSVLWTTDSTSFRAVRTVSLDLEGWKVLGGFGIGDLGERYLRDFMLKQIWGCQWIVSSDYKPLALLQQSRIKKYFLSLLCFLSFRHFDSRCETGERDQLIGSRGEQSLSLLTDMMRK